MTKYATSADSAKIVATWESLPSQLAKESGSTKFMWRYVASGAKAERYANSLDWLVAAGIVSRCTQITDGRSPPKSFENPSAFKIYHPHLRKGFRQNWLGCKRAALRGMSSF